MRTNPPLSRPTSGRPRRLRRTALAAMTAVGAGSLAAVVPLGFSAVANATTSPALWVTNDHGNTLTAYPQSADGNVSPTATITATGSGGSASLNLPLFEAFDGSGNLWVTNQLGGSSSGSIVMYGSGQLGSGAQVPTKTLNSAAFNYP
ncbi:MAG: hypothetical protein JWM85_2606, partial [Acidimicrobiaceae bacterium]|nr:hypothetical protein [Acidimicrobiaceae bacterium]